MVFPLINGLIHQGVETKLIERTDINYVQNQIIHLLKIDAFPENETEVIDDSIPNLLEKIISYAIESNVIEDVFDDKEILTASIMDCFVARPSVINDTFYKKYEQSAIAATDYFYELSKNSNYIQMNRIKKNIHFKSDTKYGELDITINLSKPEKDPEQLKRERAMKQKISYPQCVLCAENEGYVGRTGYPARANHRIIEVPLLDEAWYFQYSPYVYYQEHSILLAGEHRDMKIDRQTFTRLLTFVEKFPHYFIGSNADLPIVGGSILSHDHYQAGRYEFPMDNAKEVHNFTFNKDTTVSASILEWPLTTIRLRSDSKQKLIDLADHILQTWQEYSDEEAQVVAYSDDTRHNTITPIARMRDDQFELDLVLRNNRTTKEHPLGIFHPHQDVHHIKKENIGLIEVMGLAVLPARLKDELAEIKSFLLGQDHDIEAYHQPWANELKDKYAQLTDPTEVDKVIEKELGNKFAKVLGDAGVFKNKTAYESFISALNK